MGPSRLQTGAWFIAACNGSSESTGQMFSKFICHIGIFIEDYGGLFIDVK